MKKLLSLLLALALLAALCVPALADEAGWEETGMEEALPAEEETPAEAPMEDAELPLDVEVPAPADPAEDAPAAEEPEVGEITEEIPAPAQETGEAAASDPVPADEAQAEPSDEEAPDAAGASDEPAAEQPVPTEEAALPLTHDAQGVAGPYLRLDASGILGAQESNVYFGSFNERSRRILPVKWRVLENANGQLFLLSDLILDAMEYNTRYTTITWEKCTLRAWLNDTTGENGFARRAFSAGELAAIPETCVVNENNPTNRVPAGNDTMDRIYLLSIQEVTNPAYGFTSDDSRIAGHTSYALVGGTFYFAKSGAGLFSDVWWLRSPGVIENAAIVTRNGSIYMDGRNVDSIATGIRPALHLDLNAVLFTSAAEGGKPSGDGALTQIPSGTVVDWKLTLKDQNRQFSIFETAVEGTQGGTVELSYSGATVYDAQSAPNEYISAILVNANGEAVYYGRLTQPVASDGRVSVSIPADLPTGTYTLKLFSEQYNGDLSTDYASAFSDVTLTVTEGEPQPDSDPAEPQPDDPGTQSAWIRINWVVVNQARVVNEMAVSMNEVVVNQAQVVNETVRGQAQAVNEAVRNQAQAVNEAVVNQAQVINGIVVNQAQVINEVVVDQAQAINGIVVNQAQVVNEAALTQLQAVADKVNELVQDRVIRAAQLKSKR